MKPNVGFIVGSDPFHIRTLPVTAELNTLTRIVDEYRVLYDHGSDPERLQRNENYNHYSLSAETEL